MIYHHGQIKELQIKAFDKEGEEIAAALLIDTVTQTVWSHPVLLRDCSDTAKVMKDSNGDAGEIWRKWGCKQSPVVFQYETLLKGCSVITPEQFVRRRIEDWAGGQGVEVL